MHKTKGALAWLVIGRDQDSVDESAADEGSKEPNSAGRVGCRFFEETGWLLVYSA